jgi:deferrochelatase/peroxidase EfeB
MTVLDLPDIQGNIDRPYGRYGFPYARYLLFHISEGEGAAGRWFVDQLRRHVTTAEPWSSSRTSDAPILRPKPPVTLNIAFTWQGLLALDLPTRTLRGMPDEFIEGMACRKHILGDLGPSDPERWDKVWCEANLPGGKRVHILVALNAQAKPTDGKPVDELDVWTNWLCSLCDQEPVRGTIKLMKGHGRDGTGPWQDSNAIMACHPGTNTLVPTPKEHFGFTDGLSDPVFDGQCVLSDNPRSVIGNGKLMPGPYDMEKSWQPLATGEFILGHSSEAQELELASVPDDFMRNGTFMALRKLHQNTGTFLAAMEEHAAAYKEVAGLASLDEARETLKAKMVGRWSNGVPLTLAPTYQEMQTVLAQYPLLLKQEQGVPLTPDEARQAKAQLGEFMRATAEVRYCDDPEGVKCPLGAHLRRANPRDMLDPAPDPGTGASTLTNRRRILRRGLPYGVPTPNDEDEHGVFIMALCASLFRQFEFVQQQWMQYGLDFEAGNDTCPIIGNRDQSRKFVVAADPKSGKLPYIASPLPQFVEVRGGDYFFIPSLTALRMIAMGNIDPT